jgi:hypothetical protein
VSKYNATNPLPGYELVTRGVIEDGDIWWWVDSKESSARWRQIDDPYYLGRDVSEAWTAVGRPIDRSAEDAVVSAAMTWGDERTWLEPADYALIDAIDALQTKRGGE